MAMSISILPCYSDTAWRGRPWSENTNAPTWQALQSTYRPFEQLVEAIIERADAVRAVVNTNYPRVELVQTWTVDAGTVTNITEEGILASGFPAGSLSGRNYNGRYIKVTANRWDHEDQPDLSLERPGVFWEWELWEYDTFFPDFGSDVGPASTEWVDFVYAPVAGITVMIPALTNVTTQTTNIISTNEFAPFAYTVGTHSGTCFPHLTYAAMEWVDQQIEDLSAYYVPAVTTTSLPPSGAEIILTRDEWDAHGDFSLIGNAGVGLTVTQVVDAVTNVMSAYTRQPPVTSQWVMAEWAWGPTNRVPVVSAGVTNWVNQDGWIQGRAFETMDIRLPLTYTNGPFVGAYSVTGTPISVQVDLVGSIRTNHWFDAGIVEDRVERVTSGNYATNLFRQLKLETSVYSGVGANTGDYIIVSYKGPITLYGTRPYRLYASDLDERAAVIDGLTLLRVEHDWVTWVDGGGSTRYALAVTNAYNNYGYGDTLPKVSALEDTSTNNVLHPPWSDVGPQYSLILPDPTKTSIKEDVDWGSWSFRRRSTLFDNGEEVKYINDVSFAGTFVAAQLLYTMRVETNTCQGTNFPSQFRIVNTFPVIGRYYSSQHISLPSSAAYGWLVDGVGDTNYFMTVASLNQCVIVGTNGYVGGWIGSTNAWGGDIPTNLMANSSSVGEMQWLDFTNAPPYDAVIHDGFGWYEGFYSWTYRPPAELWFSGGWRPQWDDGGPGSAGRIGIPGFIDWGTTNGFQYRRE